MVPDPNDGTESDSDPNTGSEGSGDAGTGGRAGGPGDDPDGEGPSGPGGDDPDDGGWYGIEALTEAKDTTVALLWPPSVAVWLRLALVALFVGGTGGVPTSGFNTGGTGGSTPGGATGGDLPSLPEPPVSGESILLAVAAVVAVVVVLAVLFAAVAAVMEFVLVESLRTRTVAIRSRFRRFLRQGLRLFVFRVVLGIVTIAAVAVPLVVAFGLGVAVSPILLLLAVPAFLLLAVAALVAWVVGRVTTDFVVPTMLVEGHGVLDGWRRVWPLLREEWAQVGVYLLVRIGVGIGAGIAVSLATVVVSLVVAVPFALVAGGIVLGVGLTTPAIAVLAVLGVAFALVALIVTLLAQVVPLTFLRYYALGVLSRLDADLDVVPQLDGGSTPA
jgi:hypothetical protein